MKLLLLFFYDLKKEFSFFIPVVKVACKETIPKASEIFADNQTFDMSFESPEQ